MSMYRRTVEDGKGNIILELSEERPFTRKEKIDDWKAKMSSTDRKLPRYVEDIITALSPPVRAKIDAYTLDKYNTKKKLRSRKPK